MTDNPKDSRKSGSQPGKRPAATLDLQATEIERRDIPGNEAAGDATTSAAEAAMGASARAEDTVAIPTPDAGNASDNAAPQVKEAPAGSTSPPARAAVSPKSRPGASSFISHMLAGVVGAGLAIFGADYLANTIGLSLPTYSAVQVDQLTRRITDLEQAAKEHSSDAATSLTREQIDALKTRVDQLAGASTTLDAIQAQQKQVSDRTGKLEQLVSAGPSPTDTAGRVAKLEDQFKLLTQAGAAGQAGNVGAMAGLIAKVDGMGTALDAHLDETRKSLQADLQKQSAHFETRLSEVDKGMSVDTLKASGKALSDQIVTLRADGDKLRQDIATVAAGNESLRKDLAAVQGSTDDLKAKIQADASTFAKSQQLSDVNATATKLQSDVAAIAARDKSREEGANRILLTLQLANLKRAVDAGGAYAKELTEVKRLAPKGIDLTALDANAEKGLPTNALLVSEFKDLTWTILNADSKSSGDGSLLGELWQGARSVVQVRRTGEVAGDSTEAILARAESKLQAGDLDGALREVSQLKGDARKTAEPWMAKLASRLSIDQAMADVDSGLAKLMGTASATVN